MATPSAIQKLLAGLNASMADPSEAGTMGLAQGLLAASAPHLLTQVSMGQALGQGAASSQAYQAQSLHNMLSRIMLPMTAAKNSAIINALRNPNSYTSREYIDNILGGAAGVSNDPKIVGPVTATKSINSVHPQGPGQTLFGPLGPKAADPYGPLPTGSQIDAAGKLQLIPNAAPTIQSIAANHAYGSTQGGLPAKVAEQQSAPHALHPGSVLGSMSGVPGMAPNVARMVGAGAQPAPQRVAPPPAQLPAPTGQPAAGPGVRQGINLTTAGMQKGAADQAKEQNALYQKQAEDAKETLAQVGELRMSAHDFAPGQFAEARIKGLQWMQSLGLITPKEAQSLGSAQEGTKMSIQLQSTLTRSLGSREAAQVFATLGRGVPNLTLSPDGFGKMTAYMEGMARYNAARAARSQQYFDGGDAKGVNNVRDQYLAHSNPAYFIIASAPPQIQREMVAQMGSKARPFLERWAKATASGWAPSPTAFASQP